MTKDFRRALPRRPQIEEFRRERRSGLLTGAFTEGAAPMAK